MCERRDKVRVYSWVTFLKKTGDGTFKKNLVLCRGHPQEWLARSFSRVSMALSWN